MGWVVWTILAVLLALGEIATPGLFFLGPVAVGAVAAAIAAAVGVAALPSALVFLVCSALSLATLRPIARAHLRLPAVARTGTAALVGRRAVVTRRIDGAGGRVRIGGEEWTARSYLEGEEIEEGAQVDVVEIQGATALVMR